MVKSTDVQDIDNLKVTGVSDDAIRILKTKIMDMRKKALKKHNHKISEPTDKCRYYKTRVDPKPDDRREKLSAPTYELLLDKLVAWYFPESVIIPVKTPKKIITVKSLYPEFARTKFLDGASSNPARLWYDWKKYCLEEPLSEELISKPIWDINSLELKEWVNALNEKYHFEVHQYYNASSPLRQVLEYAKDQGYINYNPYLKNLVAKSKFSKKEKPQAETQVFFIDELDELWELADDGTVPGMAIRFMLKTGLRRAELIGLKESDFSGNGKYVNINRQYYYDFALDPNGKPVSKIPKLIEHPKSKAGERSIYVVSKAREILSEVRDYNLENGLGGDFVFRSKEYDDFHLGYEAVEKKLYRLCEKMQTIPKSQHKLRKTFISTLLDQGVNIDEVRKMAGHEDEHTTLSNYCFNRRNQEQTENQLELALA